MPHDKNKRPSNRQMHEQGLKNTKNGQENSRWKAYKANGGQLAKSAWKARGMPPRD
ncbi:MAG: hypothetical protein AAGE84_28835 [Cyanobacteria bacterium P01_G01_bin.39]